MLSMIVLVVMTITSVFMVVQMSRDAGINQTTIFKSKNIASNVLQYQDIVTKYMLKNYSQLHLSFSVSPGMVEQVSILDYSESQMANYSQKNFLPFLNYKSIAFNYVKNESGESQQTPILYTATSFDGYFESVVKTYPNILLPEVMGYLGSDLDKHLYQGNSTYWNIPWLFKQQECNIQEVYSQLPDDGSGQSALSKLNMVFNLWCKEIQASGNYKFLTYVYIQPVFDPADI